MLHQNLNSEMALGLAECQVFGVWTTIVEPLDHNCDHLPETPCSASARYARLPVAMLGEDDAGAAREFD